MKTELYILHKEACGDKSVWSTTFYSRIHHWRDTNKAINTPNMWHWWARYTAVAKEVHDWYKNYKQEKRCFGSFVEHLRKGKPKEEAIEPIKSNTNFFRSLHEKHIEKFWFDGLNFISFRQRINYGRSQKEAINIPKYWKREIYKI